MTADCDRCGDGTNVGGPARTASQDQRLLVDIVERGGAWEKFPGVEMLIGRATDAVAASPSWSIAEPASITVALSDDDDVRTLNRTFRDQDKPTNVLSFPSLPDTLDGNRRYLGDIVLAAETVASEAQTLTLAPEHHLQHLIVHGLLHLLGYDHEDERDAETMEAIEIQILRRLGIADPYADPRSCADAPQRQDQS